MPRSILLKLQPNQDVTHALERAVRDAGMTCATIPGIEVASLSGLVFAAGGSRLHGYFCCSDTSVAAGILAPGLNAVAVTFELLLTENP
jgi:predicted DNA-binding protein with PD1-like motif